MYTRKRDGKTQCIEIYRISLYERSILMLNTINMSKYLTSANFYEILLPQINYMKQYHRHNNPIILDFSKTARIEPLVIPNLLCTGKMVMGETGTRMVIHIPETLQAERVKSYMRQIDFVRLAADVYECDDTLYTGEDEKKIDPLCGSLQFSKNLEKYEIINGINGYVAPFTNEYLKNYIEYSAEDNMYVNKIDHFLYEIIDNCRKHGISDSYMTIHARYSDRKIYMAISDWGTGFLNSWNNRDKDTEDLKVELELLNGKKPKNEMEAIMCGVYKRKNSKIYGLYNIIFQTLELGGIIRIHSTNTRLLFTPRLCKKLREQTVLRDKSFFEYNFKNNLDFKGVHVEMEIPF